LGQQVKAAQNGNLSFGLGEQVRTIPTQVGSRQQSANVGLGNPTLQQWVQTFIGQHDISPGEVYLY